MLTSFPLSLNMGNKDYAYGLTEVHSSLSALICWPWLLYRMSLRLLWLHVYVYVIHKCTCICLFTFQFHRMYTVCVTECNQVRNIVHTVYIGIYHNIPTHTTFQNTCTCTCTYTYTTWTCMFEFPYSNDSRIPFPPPARPGFSVSLPSL